MKAYMYRESGSPWKLEDVEDPHPGPGEVLIKLGAAGVCGTDLGYRYGRTSPKSVPLIPGHEAAGTVTALGDGVEDLAGGPAEGDKVCVHYVISCGRCRHCDEGNDNRCRNRRSVGTHVNGGFAEYIKVPARNAFVLPESVSLAQGAIIGCAVSTAYHVVNVGALQKGDTVAVFGLGGVGMHVVEWARILGAGQIIGIDNVDSKLEAAAGFGADITIHSEREKVSEKILSLTDGYGADLVFECAGHPSCMEEAIRCIHGKSAYESGRVVGVAAFLDPIVLDQAWLFREGAFLRSGDHTKSELRQVIQLAASGRIDLSPSVTHEFPFSELEETMTALEGRQKGIIRSVLTFD